MDKDYIFTARRKSGSGFGGNPGKIRFLGVPEASQDAAPTHTMPKADWLREVTQIARTDGDAPRAGLPPGTEEQGNVLIHVHGFNIDTSEMLERHRKLRRGLRAQGYDGAVVSFDWPSEGVTS